MTLEVHIRIQKEDREKLLQEFLAGEKRPKPPEVEKRVKEGYKDLLRDLRRFGYPRKLPANLDTTTLKGRFIDFVNSHDQYSITRLTVDELVLINLYGLQDGVRRSRVQIAQVLGYANSSSIDPRAGYNRLYAFLAWPKKSN